jgi:hypothetical protein
MEHRLVIWESKSGAQQIVDKLICISGGGLITAAILVALFGLGKINLTF